jgi:LAGLIDADG DNA endonuclease family protein
MTDLTLRRYILKTLKINNYKCEYRLMNKLPQYLNDTLIGLLLSDGGLQRSTDTSNVRLSVTMSVKSYPYIFHLYNLFEPYIDTDLNIIDIKNSKKINYNRNYSTIRFKTISAPQFIYYYNIFYKKNIILNKWEKVIPLELKYNFNAISLAHLIMGDGNYLRKRNIIRIYTNSYIQSDVILLSNIIKENLSINSKVIHDRNNQYIIVIEKDNVDLTRKIILSYMHPSMLYKLGISNDTIFSSKFNYFNIINKI